jgi:hypothetical protein
LGIVLNKNVWLRAFRKSYRRGWVVDYPFDGELRVGPEAFELVLRRIEDQ